MGQAKKRGTFEDRQRQAVEARKIREERDDAEREARYARRRVRQRAPLRILPFLGLSIGGGLID